MTEYESFLERFDEINLIEDEDQQNDEFALLDQDIENWVNKKYPELQYYFTLCEPADELMDSEEKFIKDQIGKHMGIYNLIDLFGLNIEELLNNYIKSKNE